MYVIVCHGVTIKWHHNISATDAELLYILHLEECVNLIENLLSIYKFLNKYNVSVGILDCLWHYNFERLCSCLWKISSFIVYLTHSYIFITPLPAEPRGRCFDRDWLFFDVDVLNLEVWQCNYMKHHCHWLSERDMAIKGWKPGREISLVPSVHVDIIITALALRSISRQSGSRNTHVRSGWFDIQTRGVCKPVKYYWWR